MRTLEEIYELQMTPRCRFHAYYVLENGLVYSCKARKYLKGHVRKGYQRHSLRVDGVSKIFTTHRLVLELFRGAGSKFQEVNHIDGDKSNNHVSNLEWVTRSENIKHAYDNNLIPDRKGYKNSNAKLSKVEREKILEMKSKGFKSTKLAEMYHVNVSTIQRIIKKGY